jgi:hypothetical protein
MSLRITCALAVCLCAALAQASVTVTTLHQFTPINAGVTESPHGDGAFVLKYTSQANETKVHFVAHGLLPGKRYGVLVLADGGGFSVAPSDSAALVTDRNGHGSFEYAYPADLTAHAFATVWLCGVSLSDLPCGMDPFVLGTANARLLAVDTGVTVTTLTAFTPTGSGTVENPAADGACVLKHIVTPIDVINPDCGCNDYTKMHLIVNHMLPNTSYGVKLDSLGSGFNAPPNVTGGALITNGVGHGTFEFTLPQDATGQAMVTLWLCDGLIADCDSDPDTGAANGARVVITSNH